MAASLLELDEVFRRQAWAIWKKDANFIKRHMLSEEDYLCKVDWAALTIEHRLVKFEPKQEEGTEIETNWGKVVTGSRWVPLWGTLFGNNSNTKQSHTFRGSRDTTTWVDIDLSQGYTQDGEVNIQVNIPPDFRKFCAGRNSSFSLNKVKGQAFKEILTWEVNSQVEVQPGWRANAQLLAREECNVVEFEIRTTIGCPKGVVPVNFVKRSDNRNVHTIQLENFNDGFKLVEEGGVLSPEEKALTEVMVQNDISLSGELQKSSCMPQIITRGSCVSVSWTDQKVDISTSPSGQDSITDGTTDSSRSGVVEISEIKNIEVKSF